MSLKIPHAPASSSKSPVRGEQVAELQQPLTQQSRADVGKLKDAVRDVFSAENLRTPGSFAANLPPSLKALLTPIPKSTGPRPDPSVVEATVESVARIVSDGAVGESTIRAVANARVQIEAVLGLKTHVRNLPPEVRERVETLLLAPLERLKEVLEGAATLVVEKIATRDHDALKQRLTEPGRLDTLDPAAVRCSPNPPSFAAPERFLVGDLILVPRSSGPATLGVVVGHDPDGVRVEVEGPAGFGVKTLSAAQIASANPFRIGDVFTARGMSMHVTGAAPDGTLRILPYDPAHPDRVVFTRSGTFAAEVAAEVAAELVAARQAPPSAPTPVSTNPAHYARTGGNVVGAYLDNAVQSSTLFSERIASQKTPWTAASVSALLSDMHKVACLGVNGDRPYTSGHYSTDAIHPGQMRGEGMPRSSRARAGHYADAITKQLGLPAPIDGSVAVRGVDAREQPVSFVNGMHFYPDGGSLEPYMKSAASILEALRKTPPPPPGTKGSSAVVDQVADLYHVLANARPFDQVNNSMFMSQVNVLLTRHGHAPVPHGWIDHLAHRLPAESFRKVFAAHLAGALPEPATLGIEKF
jgi:hypothetical protein